ncbi:TonB-dependent receptor [uncultured Tenacibaculum sp.]|uniref:TonB-dependent receptor n=1 Tax=Tenacibaculum sp. A30 TaxID=3442644 RepID=UPI00260ACCFA|nr:TonB-dependent receptor [uncultured Tenacibaculum sp.]
MTRVFVVILFVLSDFFCFSQVKILGKVIDKQRKPISYATIQLVEKESELTKSYTSSNEKGNFSFIVSGSLNGYYLKTTLLGYKPQKTNFQKNNLTNIIILEEQTTTLKEVIISSNYKEFTLKKDSITYNLSKIRDSTETNLKDLVEKLPGLTIDDNKKINFQGNKIDKVVVEGEDFFGKKHEMATENLPVEAIQGIQIIKNFKEFDDIGNKKSGKIVLNVTLHKNYKNKIVGNVEGNSGVDKKYQFHTNLFKFIKKGNFALVSEANNIGEPAINMSDYIEMQGGIGNFTSNYHEGGSGIYEIDHAKTPRYVFVNKNVDSRSTIFNSLNFVNKLSKKTKVNGYVTYDYTKIQEQKRNYKNFIGVDTLTTQETENSLVKSNLGNSFLNFTYKKDEDEALKYNLKLNPFKNNENIIIKGNTNFDNKIIDNDFLIGQYLEYKNQLTSKLYLKSGLSYDYKTQQRDFILTSDQPFFNLVFSNDYNFRQETNVKQHSINVNSKIVYDLKEQTKLTTSFFYINNNEELINKASNQPDFYFNADKKQTQFSWFNSLSHEFNKQLSVNASLSYISNRLKVLSQKRNYNWLLPNFSMSFRFNNGRELGISYSKSKKNISIFQMNTQNRVLNYQTIILNNNDVFTPVKKETFTLSFDDFNSKKNRMLSVQANYFKSKNQIGFSSSFKDNFIEQEYIRVPEDGFEVNLYHTKTIHSLPLRWNAKLSYKKTNSLSYFKEEKNNNKTNNYDIDVRFTSMFKKTPFQTKLNLYFSNSILKNDFSNLDYSYTKLNIHPKVYGKVGDIVWSLGCLYQNIKSNNNKESVYSLNFSTKWNFNKEIQLFLKGANILNLQENQFASIQNTEAYSLLTVFERLEGNVLVGLRYHF